MTNQQYMKWVLELINQEGYKTVAYLDAECSKYGVRL